jgi:hypothetical protein
VFTTSSGGTVGGDSTYTSGSYTTTAAGTYTWEFSYTGDSYNNGGSACGGTNETLTVNKATPGLSTSATSSISVGSGVTDTATLSNGYNPTGAITYTLYGPSPTESCTTQVGQVTSTVTANGNYTSPAIMPTEAGTYWWTASYGGDGNNQSAADPCGSSGESSTVTPVTPTITTSATPSSVATGGSVADQAQFSGGYSPTGTITWKLYSGSGCTGTPVFTTSSGGTVSGNSTYTSGSYTTTAAGTYTWEFSYTGDTNNNPVSACGGTGETLSVLNATSLTNLTAPATDAVNTAISGSSVGTTLSGGTTSPAVSGTITFSVFGPQTLAPNTCTGAGWTSLSPTTSVSGNNTYQGSASASFTPTMAGTYWWYASYGGDTLNGSSSTTCGSGMTSTVVSSSTPPTITSANSTTFTAGESGSFTVTTSGSPTVTSITESGTLPTGVAFNYTSGSTATLSGTPTQGGIFNITITASNGVSPNATQNFTLTVNLTASSPPGTYTYVVPPGYANVNFTSCGGGGGGGATPTSGGAGGGGGAGECQTGTINVPPSGTTLTVYVGGGGAAGTAAGAAGGGVTSYGNGGAGGGAATGGGGGGGGGASIITAGSTYIVSDPGGGGGSGGGATTSSGTGGAGKAGGNAGDGGAGTTNGTAGTAGSAGSQGSGTAPYNGWGEGGGAGGAGDGAGGTGGTGAGLASSCNVGTPSSSTGGNGTGGTGPNPGNGGAGGTTTLNGGAGGGGGGGYYGGGGGGGGGGSNCGGGGGGGSGGGGQIYDYPTAGVYLVSVSAHNLTTSTGGTAGNAGTNGSVSISLGQAVKLAFTTSPSTPTNAGTAFSTQPVVKVENAATSSVITWDSTSTVTLAIASGTPTSGGPGTLTCTNNTVTVSSGVASFAGCEVNTAGTGYTLTATDTSDGLTAPSAASSAFTITEALGPTENVAGTSGTESATLSGTPTAGSTMVLLVYSDGSTSTPSFSGAGISGTPTEITSQSPGGSYEVWAYDATASGTSTTVGVSVGGSPSYVDLYAAVLYGANPSSPIAQDKPNTGTSKTPTAILSSTPVTGDYEFAILGTDGTSGTVGAAPSGWTRLGTNENGAGYGVGSFYTSTGSTSQAFSITDSVPWATIALDIAQ